MVDKKDEFEEVNDWLRERMTEEDFSPTEIAEFTNWLRSRDCEQKEVERHATGISFGDVVELVSWLGGRMKEVAVHPEERRDLVGWLTGKLSAHTCLSADEIQHINNVLDRDHDK